MAWHIGFNGSNGHDVGLSEGGGGGPHVQASVPLHPITTLEEPEFRWTGGSRCGLWGYVGNLTPIV